ncbi:MAG: elongation factor 1-beta [Candidatus Diapherotrites archaeon]|nr:elongation factor 1-beta [Candidatus Diapherotrites archaeon]
MGEVIVMFKVMPSEVDQYDTMKQKVLDIVKAEKVEEDYVAFGLKALKITVVMPDSKGGTDELEQKLTAIPEVGSVQLEGVGRI